MKLKRAFAFTCYIATALWAGALVPAAEIALTTDAPGRVSAAVYDAEGRLLRELLRGERLDAGTHRLRWDGLDREGNPQPPGSYTWRTLRTPGFRAQYVTSLGIRPGTAPYDTWVGNHAGVASVAVDATGLYAAATITETAPVLLKQSVDGQTRHWTRKRGDVTRGRFQGGVALAADGRGRLYMLQQNGYLQVIDAAEGHRLATWDVLPAGKERNHEEGDQFYRHGQTIAAVDLAARGDTVVLSQREQERLTWLNPDTGEPAATLELDAPAGVTVGTGGAVFAISGSRVLQVAPDGVRRTVVADGLDAPARLAYDPTDDTLVVAEWGERRQVHRFALDGRRLATHGREGGRQDGRYVPSDFLQVAAIAADGQGGFIVAEQTPAPRRVARFDREGKLLDEWYGGQPYYAWGEPDPREPTRAWFNPGDWLTLAEIDPATGSWRVLENYRQDRLGEGLVQPVTEHRGRWRVLYRGDRRFLVSETVPQVLRHEPGRLRAVALVSNQPDRVRQAAERAGYRGEARAYRWIDRNGDGAAQPDEFTFSPSPQITEGRSVSDGFEVVGITSGEEGGRAYVRITGTRPQWTEFALEYPIGEEPGVNTVVADLTVDSPAGTGGTRGVGAYRDRDGNYYAHFNTSADRHGETWPTLWGGQSRFVQVDAHGNERWRVGRHAIHGGLGQSPHTTTPGYLHVPAAIIGEVRDTVVLTDRVEWMGKVWTKDGLYVGNVLDGRVDDGLPDVVYYWWRTPDGTEAIVTSDNATGGAIVEAPDGAVWFFTQGRNSVPVYKIHGWDGWQRQSGTLIIERTPPHAARRGIGLTAAYYLAAEAAGTEREPERGEPSLRAASFAVVGEPRAVRLEPCVWHGSPRGRPGHHEIVDGFPTGPAVDWSRGVPPLGAARGEQQPEPFAVRWTGQIEAPLTEPFTLSVYARGGVRLWIDGRQVVFGWNEGVERREAAPIPLEAGRRYDVQLDFYSTQPAPALSLNWESPSLDRRRIPTDYLYPEFGRASSEQVRRPAIEPIEADTFDATNIPGEHRRQSTSGLRQRGLGISGAYLRYDGLEFGDGVSGLRVRASGRPAGRVEFAVTLAFRLGSPEGPTIAQLRFDPDTGIPPDHVSLNQPVRGMHDLYIVNTTPEKWHFVHLEQFVFD